MCQSRPGWKVTVCASWTRKRWMPSVGITMEGTSSLSMSCRRGGSCGPRSAGPGGAWQCLLIEPESPAGPAELRVPSSNWHAPAASVPWLAPGRAGAASPGCRSGSLAACLDPSSSDRTVLHHYMIGNGGRRYEIFTNRNEKGLVGSQTSPWGSPDGSRWIEMDPDGSPDGSHWQMDSDGDPDGSPDRLRWVSDRLR